MQEQIKAEKSALWILLTGGALGAAIGAWGLRGIIIAGASAVVVPLVVKYVALVWGSNTTRACLEEELHAFTPQQVKVVDTERCTCGE